MTTPQRGKDTATDTTAPAAPVVAINDDGSSVTVTGEEGATVTITTPTGTINGTIGADGTFTSVLTPALTNGEEVSATLMDADDNTSALGKDTATELLLRQRYQQIIKMMLEMKQMITVQRLVQMIAPLVSISAPI